MSLTTLTDHEQAARIAGFASGYNYGQIVQEFVNPLPTVCPEQFRDVEPVWRGSFNDGLAEYASFFEDDTPSERTWVDAWSSEDLSPDFGA